MKVFVMTLMTIFALAVFTIGCDTPTGGTVIDIQNGNGNVDVDVTTNEVDSSGEQAGDIIVGEEGGCCDGNDGNDDQVCNSIPSGTEVPCSTCIQFGGTRDCSVTNK